MSFKRSNRQKIVDDYLNVTGKYIFIPGEFVDWLEGQPEHQCYHWFFGQDDEKLAREYRIGLARRLVAGCRIVVKTSETVASVVHVKIREYPAFISPLAGRKDGGGYHRTKADDPEDMAELRHQGALALRSWLKSFRGAFEDAGVDLAPIEQIAAFAEADDGVAVAAE